MASRADNPGLMTFQASEDKRKHSVWSYRIIDPVAIGDRDVFLGNCGVYHVYGYTMMPSQHIIGIVEFLEPVSEQHVESIIGGQFSGSLLMQPLMEVTHCEKTLKCIKNVNDTGGAWVEHSRGSAGIVVIGETVPHREEERGYPSDQGEDYENYDEEEDDSTFSYPEYQLANPNPPDPNEETFDPVEALADLGERLAAHI